MPDAKTDLLHDERRSSMLAFAAIAAVLAWTFAELTDELFSRDENPNDILAIDRNILIMASRMRRSWLTPIAIDVSAMGSSVVLGLVTFVAVLVLVMVQRTRHATQMSVASIGAAVLTTILKVTLARARPEIVTHIAQASGFAYPSGHSLGAATVFTTSAIIIAQHLRRGIHKMVVSVMATFLIVLVCLSRVYLGVHYPSDVAAGLVAGCAWCDLVSATMTLTSTRHKAI